MQACMVLVSFLLHSDMAVPCINSIGGYQKNRNKYKQCYISIKQEVIAMASGELQIVSMIKVNGIWRNQNEIPREELCQLLERKIDSSMESIGFIRKKTA